MVVRVTPYFAVRHVKLTTLLHTVTEGQHNLLATQVISLDSWSVCRPAMAQDCHPCQPMPTHGPLHHFWQLMQTGSVSTYSVLMHIRTLSLWPYPIDGILLSACQQQKKLCAGQGYSGICSAARAGHEEPKQDLENLAGVRWLYSDRYEQSRPVTNSLWDLHSASRLCVKDLHAYQLYDSSRCHHYDVVYLSTLHLWVYLYVSPWHHSHGQLPLNSHAKPLQAPTIHPAKLLLTLATWHSHMGLWLLHLTG